MALGDQQLCIMECLHEFYSGIRGHSMGIDKYFLPVVLPTLADLVGTLSYAQ